MNEGQLKDVTRMLRQLTIERTAQITIFVLLFALATRIPLDTDTWWHLRSAEHTLTRGMIYADPFSHTMDGQPWTNHSWLSQIILLGAWRLAGDTGLAVYTALLATLGMYMVYRMSSGSIYIRALALILGAATAAVFWSPRPQMMSFFLSTVLLYILYLYKYRATDRLWFIPPLMALWGNLHAGFSIGFILLGGTIAGEILGNLFARGSADLIAWRGIRKLIIVGIVSLAALLLNPYGLQMLLVPFQTVSIGALSAYIQEWQSPNFQGRETWSFVVLLLLTFGAAGASSRRLNWTDFLLCAGTAFMALLAGRNIALFAVVATPVLTRHVDAILSERGWVITPLKRVNPRMGILNAVLLVLVCVGALAKVIWTLTPIQVAEAKADVLPIASTDYLRQHPPAGTLFNSYNWGGYLMYAAPDIPVFVDGRTDLYGDVLLNRYLQAASGGDEWRAVLDEYDVTAVMIEPNSGLGLALRTAEDWQEVYRDDLSVIFEREGT
jgi:hypothetical protein